VRREWELEDLIDCWTLDEEDAKLLAKKSGATRLAFALALKFFELEARFPRHAGELPPAAVGFVAGQLKAAPVLFAAYGWSGRTAEHHRAQIRAALGFREPAVGDEDKLVEWLASEVCPAEPSRDRLRLALLARCRRVQIEPPGPSRIERILGTAEALSERRFTTRTAGRLTPGAVARLEELIAPGDPDSDAAGGGSFLQELKADPGQPGLEALLGEIAKLDRVRAIGLPASLFTDAPEKLVIAWRSRAARMYPSDFAKAPDPVKLTLLAEARADERAFSTRVRVQLRSSYSHHYRRGLPKLLKALRFRCNNTAHKPVMDALDLLERYDGSAEKPPLE
jgi:hypothetical protein